MRRRLAGSFATTEARDVRPARALAPEQASVLEPGPLQIAYTGPRVQAGGELCLLDGYIDNAGEIAAQLHASDGLAVEQLLALAWRAWGAELLPRLRGDFALLLWAQERGEGLLARDQLGARSLFLREQNGGVLFASEIRSLLALCPQRPAPDPLSLAHWLATSNRPGSATLYEGIRRLGPGSALLLEAGSVRELAYWRPRYLAPLAGSGEHLATLVADALSTSVRRRVPAQGIAGVLMSGGLDSASVAALAADVAPGRVRACSAEFPEHDAVDESALIAELRRSLGLGGVSAEVHAGGLLQSALEAIEMWQLPLRSWGDFWALPLLRAAAASGVEVMLGGDGGDELFAVRAHLLADRLRQGRLGEVRMLLRQLPGAAAGPGRRRMLGMAFELALLGALPHAPHDHLARLSRGRVAPSWLLPRVAGDLRESRDPLAWKRLDGPRWWAHAAHAMTRGIEEAGVLEHHRRRSEAAGVEVRHPLLDLDLVELGLRLAPLASFDPHRNRPLLRTAMAGTLPDAVRKRAAKARFESLLVDCLAAEGPAIRELLCAPRAEVGAYVNLAGMRRSLFEQDRLRRERPFQWMWYVWRLLTAECWLRSQSGRLGEVAASVRRVRVREVVPQHSAGSYVFPP
jgi:asparagine synthase (glutamine-hydrolysing)